MGKEGKWTVEAHFCLKHRKREKTKNRKRDGGWDPTL